MNLPPDDVFADLDEAELPRRGPSMKLPPGVEVPEGLTAYAEIVDDLSPDELRAECLRLRADHDETCRLAWELYCAGTEQDLDTFRGVGVGPVEDVRAHVDRLRAEALGAEILAALVDRPEGEGLQ